MARGQQAGAPRGCRERVREAGNLLEVFDWLCQEPRLMAAGPHTPPSLVRVPSATPAVEGTG